LRYHLRVREALAATQAPHAQAAGVTVGSASRRVDASGPAGRAGTPTLAQADRLPGRASVTARKPEAAAGAPCGDDQLRDVAGRDHRRAHDRHAATPSGGHAAATNPAIRLLRQLSPTPRTLQTETKAPCSFAPTGDTGRLPLSRPTATAPSRGRPTNLLATPTSSRVPSNDVVVLPAALHLVLEVHDYGVQTTGIRAGGILASTGLRDRRRAGAAPAGPSRRGRYATASPCGVLFGSYSRGDGVRHEAA
jgi:hypothetical protein